MHHPTDSITHTMAFVIQLVEHWLEQEMAEWNDASHHEQMLYHRSWFFKYQYQLGVDMKQFHISWTLYHGRKEGNVLFNDALNTFYLRLYGVGHMVNDHSDSERENTLLPHGLLFSINSKGSFICTIPQPLLHQSWSTGWNEK